MLIILQCLLKNRKIYKLFFILLNTKYKIYKYLIPIFTKYIVIVPIIILKTVR